MRKKVYISGPISGVEASAYKVFEKTEKELRAKGFNPVNPIKLNHNHGKTWEEYMRVDLKALLECDEMVMLKGWENSRGACLERIVAGSIGIKITEE
jgi:nucleoside 2-deoxyribosyltransferase